MTKGKQEVGKDGIRGTIEWDLNNSNAEGTPKLLPTHSTTHGNII